MQRSTRSIAALLVAGIALSGCATEQAAQPEAGWTTLYEAGMNLNSWTRLADANWRIQDGVLQADLLGGKTPSYLVSKEVYGDFQIRAEFWVDSHTNSGIFLRCADPEKVGAKTCYEVNIWDTRPDPTYGTGAIVDVAKVSPMPKAGGRWNTYEITAKGAQLTVVLNGIKTAEAVDAQHSRGHVALQYGSGIVKFRKVQIRAL